jgi:site-specific recombinase XerC
MDESACVHLRGKGRKQRSTPLWKSTVQEIRAWLGRNPTLGADAALLPNREGHAMTRCNVTQRLDIGGGPRSQGAQQSLKSEHLAAYD